MIFSFYKYLKPIGYYNLKSKIDFGYFPTIKQLEDADISYTVDYSYKSKTAQERDIAWTAFQQGFINKNYNEGVNIWQKINIPIHDEYVFLRKNFHPAWVIYVLILRLLTLHNPFKEVVLFYRTRRIKRFDYAKEHIKYKD